MEQDYDHLFKVILIGDSSVGKTSVLLRYVDDIFNPEFQLTLGFEFRISRFQLNGKIIKLQVWDTACLDRFKNIVAPYYRGAHGIILAFDITNSLSFQNISRWYDEAQNYLQKTVPTLLIGNKADLSSQRTVNIDDAKELAARLGVEYIETSAKNSQNISLPFETLSRSILNKVMSAGTAEGSSNKTTLYPSRPVKGACYS